MSAARPLARDEVRVAVIGFGLAGATFHAPFIAITPGLRLAGIVTRDPGRREQAERSYPGVEVLSSADGIFARPRDFDLVIVASPNPTHAALATAALESDLHVVVEKPFAGSSAEARAVVELAMQRGLLVVPFHNRRWDGDFMTVRKLVSDGALGGIMRFESRFERWRPSPKPRWCDAGAAANHEGIVYDIGPHLVDQAITLLGPVREVYAELDRRNPAVQVVDDALITLTHVSGARSRLYASIVAAQPGPRFLVHGADSAYLKFGLDPQEDRLRAGAEAADPDLGREPEDRWGLLGVGADARAIPTEPGTYGTFYVGVAHTLRKGAAPPVDARDAIRGLEILEAAYASAAERRAIALAQR